VQVPLTLTHLHLQGSKQAQRTTPDTRQDGKALTPCIALVDKGGKGFPFKHIR